MGVLSDAEDIQPKREEFSVTDEESFEATEPPKRRRGRPPGSRNTGARVGRPRKVALETQIGAFLVTVNMPLQLVPALQRDALDPLEIQALAKAINQQCEASPRFRKYVEQALKVQGSTNIIAVLAVIAARRGVRHNLLPIPEDNQAGLTPEGVDALLGGVVAMMANQSPMAPGIQVPVAAE